MNNDKTVAVCGITGNQGNAAARELINGGYTVKGLTRDPGKTQARELAALGARIVKCDLDKTDEVTNALTGCWGAFGVFTFMPGGTEREEQQARRFAQAVVSAGVKHYVYSSVASADKKTGIPHFENKRRVELFIKELGVKSCTILRPAFFMDNFRSPWMLPELEKGRLPVPLKPETRLAMVAVEDIGRYARLAFDHRAKLAGKTLELAGDSCTMPEVASVLEGQLHRPVQFVQVPLEEARRAGRELAQMYEWFDRTGLRVDREGLVKQYELKPLNLRQWAARVKWPANVR